MISLLIQDIYYILIVGFRDITRKLDEDYSIRGLIPHCKQTNQPDSDEELAEEVNTNQIPVREGNHTRRVTKVY